MSHPPMLVRCRYKGNTGADCSPTKVLLMDEVPVLLRVHHISCKSPLQGCGRTRVETALPPVVIVSRGNRCPAGNFRLRG